MKQKIITMKYALVNSERQEAKPKLNGKCICCDSPVIAKCGRVKIWHWAHKVKQMCDPWKENETPWHRAWKDRFPKEWQEIIHRDENGVKHIADVKIDQTYVIEFQHSPISLEERQSRENFYKKMIWIVDGTKRSTDKEKFIDIWKRSNIVFYNGKIEVRTLHIHFAKCALLRDWSDSTVPVFFDFGEDILWFLLPKTKTIEGRYALGMKRNELISDMLNSPKESFETLLQLSNDLSILIRRSLQTQPMRYPSQRGRRTL